MLPEDPLEMELRAWCAEQDCEGFSPTETAALVPAGFSPTARAFRPQHGHETSPQNEGRKRGRWKRWSGPLSKLIVTVVYDVLYGPTKHGPAQHGPAQPLLAPYLTRSHLC